MLYFVRHGQSRANVDNVFAGPNYPSPLTAVGVAQAEVLAERILGERLRVDRIVCSPLERAHDTAQIIGKAIGIDPEAIQTDARLAEYNMGELSGHSIGSGPPTKALSAPGSEGAEAFYARVKAAISGLAKLPGNTLIVSHGGVGRMITIIQKGLDPSQLYEAAEYPTDKIVPVTPSSLV